MGRIICCGLGPGDPDLISVRADRVIRAAPACRVFPQERSARPGAAHRRGDARAGRAGISDGISCHDGTST